MSNVPEAEAEIARSRSLKLPPAVSASNDPSLAWTAGFLEGEGNFVWNNGGPVVRANQVNREPLDRLHRLYGGSVNVCGGPRRLEYNPNRQTLWRWNLTGQCARELIVVLMPEMSEKRQEQMRRALEPPAVKRMAA